MFSANKLLNQQRLVCFKHLAQSSCGLQAGTVTVKNSCSRNLHRLLSSISFISSLLHNLGSSSSCTLHTAASNAYNGSMAQIHNFFVRTAVKTSMYTLPTRQGFLDSIGETGWCPEIFLIFHVHLCLRMWLLLSLVHLHMTCLPLSHTASEQISKY